MNVIRKLFRIGHNDGGWYVYPYTCPPRDRSLVRGDEKSWKGAVRFCCLMNRAASAWLRTNELTVAKDVLIREQKGLIGIMEDRKDELEERLDILIDEVAALETIAQLQSNIVTMLEGKETKLYAVALMAMKNLPAERRIAIYVEAHILRATSDDEALDLARQRVKEIYPPEQYESHTVGITEIMMRIGEERTTRVPTLSPWLPDVTNHKHRRGE